MEKNMKKWMLYISVALNAILIITLIVILIPSEPVLVDLSTYTQQDLDKAKDVKLGMPDAQVIKIMGNPAVKEFSSKLEEWHYCKTGHDVDEYVVIKLENNKVTALHNYTVSWLDVVFHHTDTPTEALINTGGMGDCKLTAGWGTYKHAPN